MEYQQIAAAAFFFRVQYGPVAPFWGVGVLERCGRGACGVVFGTLLGPEATGPVSLAPFCGGGGCRDLFVSGFLAASSTHALRVWGVWFGVVV